MAEANRVYVNTATVGTGTLTLGVVKSAAFCTFAEAGAVDGDEIRSFIIEEGNDFEIVVGIYNSAGPTLTRATVRLSRIASAVGTTKMNLLGTATVRCIAAAEDLVTKDTSGNVSIAGEMTAKTLRPTSSFVSGIPIVDASGIASLSVAAAGNAVIATGNGYWEIFIAETNGGVSAKFITAGGNVVLVAQSGSSFSVSSSPAALGVQWDGGTNIKVYNGTGTTRLFKVLLKRAA